MSRKKQDVIFASAARTATSSANFGCRATEGLFFIHCSAYTATGSVVFTILGESPSGVTYTILASAAIVGTGLTVLRVSPQLTASANTIAKDLLPSNIKVTATHANGVSLTYSVYFDGQDD